MAVCDTPALWSLLSKNDTCSKGSIEESVFQANSNILFINTHSSLDEIPINQEMGYHIWSYYFQNVIHPPDTGEITQAPKTWGGFSGKFQINFSAGLK